ncbi:hypothetical protein [Roseibium sp. SCP14]|uniref:hypothetical protein n=1 Tax=Roseibium sp. SCP14 TaxID=3141375 RepID=UPI0033388471
MLVLFGSPWNAVNADDSPDAAISACVPAGVEAVAVEEKSADRVFVSRTGQRFLATDIQSHASDRSSILVAHGSDAAGNRQVLEAIPAGPANRWGFIPAWIVVREADASRLLQAAELEAGVAVFAPDKASGPCADHLRQAETLARGEKSGIWARGKHLPVYSAADLKELEASAGQYVIAHGRVVSLGKTRSTRYLNFGRYWKTDFTVTLKASDEAEFDAALGRNGWRIEDLANKTVEIRGVVQVRDGPLIVLRHPEQLAVLEDKRAGRGGRNIN